MSWLVEQSCRPCNGDTQRLSPDNVNSFLAELDSNWTVTDDRQSISREFLFKNYYQTIAFVNALAWIAHNQDHHPDLEVGYNRCRVIYSTHAIGGLSENDFICAARIDTLLR